MHQGGTNMTSVRRIAPAIAALALLALPTTAMAKGKDSDRDGMPNSWEKAHGLKVHAYDARADKDHDGLKNLAEYKLGTDPQNVDSDGDGIDDGQDVGGKVDSFTGGVLTVLLPDGSKVSGKVVDGTTELTCAPKQPTAPPTTQPTARAAGHDEGGDGGNPGDDQQAQPAQPAQPGRPGQPAQPAVPAQPAQGQFNQNDDGNAQNDGENGDDDSDATACGIEALTAGTAVNEAELKITSAGPVWDEVKLLK
jgi:hypothetical protein